VPFSLSGRLAHWVRAKCHRVLLLCERPRAGPLGHRPPTTLRRRWSPPIFHYSPHWLTFSTSRRAMSIGHHAKGDGTPSRLFPVRWIVRALPMAASRGERKPPAVLKTTGGLLMAVSSAHHERAICDAGERPHSSAAQPSRRPTSRLSPTLVRTPRPRPQEQRSFCDGIPHLTSQ